LAIRLLIGFFMGCVLVPSGNNYLSSSIASAVAGHVYRPSPGARWIEARRGLVFFGNRSGKNKGPTTMFAKVWDLIKDTVSGFLEDETLSRAAAIAYFTIFSVLLL
jgi:hypothetical protein